MDDKILSLMMNKPIVIPRIIFNNYKRLNITEEELIVLIFIIDLGNKIVYNHDIFVKELNIENNMEQRSYMVMISLKPEPIPLDLKVIIIGEENIYQSLLAMDNDFRKLFKIKVEFEDDAPITSESINKTLL